MPKGSKIQQCWLDYVKNALRKKNDKHFNCLLKMLTVLQQQIWQEDISKQWNSNSEGSLGQFSQHQQTGGNR